MKQETLLTTEDWKNLEDRITLLLFAGLDYCENTNRDETMWFSPNNPYNAEAFGICQALEVLGCGCFGPDFSDIYYNNQFNLKFWFRSLEERVKLIGKEMGPKQSYLHYKKQYYGKSN